MTDVNTNLLFFLCPLVFCAGFIDSIAGGGGLISLTAYMSCGIPGTFALGTNKFSSAVGSTIASVNYFRTKNFEYKSLLGAMVTAFVGSWLGSGFAKKIDGNIFSYIMLILTPIIAILIAVKKEYCGHEKVRKTADLVFLGAAIGLVVGFYDGFYGPGTGVFLQIGFIFIVGLDVKSSCGNARMVNWTSNIAALTNFIIGKNVIYKIAIPCAICSVIGNWLGSRLAIKKSVKVIRPAMLCVTGLLFLKVLIGLF